MSKINISGHSNAELLPEVVGQSINYNGWPVGKITSIDADNKTFYGYLDDSLFRVEIPNQVRSVSIEFKEEIK